MRKELNLLMSTDVELAVLSRGHYENRELANTIAPPLFFSEVLKIKPLGFLKNDKDKPIFVRSEVGTWFGDGALFEVALPPAKNHADFTIKYSKALKELSFWLRSVEAKTKTKYVISRLPAERFNLNAFSDLERIKSACISGCNPDKNALIEGYEPRVSDLSNWHMRGCGGHIHMSVDKKIWGDALHDLQRPLLKMLVISAGNVANMIANKLEFFTPSLRRLERFGHPGSYRTPIYPKNIKGFEYRSPSNSWVVSTRDHETMFKAVYFALNTLLNRKTRARNYTKTFLDDSIEAILALDKLKSYEILKHLGLQY